MLLTQMGCGYFRWGQGLHTAGLGRCCESDEKAGWQTLTRDRPSITSAIWGERNLGRNFGILSYAPLVGTPIFTYLYAWSSEGERPEGVNWRTTFTICGTVVGVALMGCGVLWRRWSGRL